MKASISCWVRPITAIRAQSHFLRCTAHRLKVGDSKLWLGTVRWVQTLTPLWGYLEQLFELQFPDHTRGDNYSDFTVGVQIKWDAIYLKGSGLVSPPRGCSIIISCWNYDGWTLLIFPLWKPTQEMYIGALVWGVHEGSWVMQFNGWITQVLLLDNLLEAEICDPEVLI